MSRLGAPLRKNNSEQTRALPKHNGCRDRLRQQRGLTAWRRTLECGFLERHHRLLAGQDGREQTSRLRKQAVHKKAPSRKLCGVKPALVFGVLCQRQLSHACPKKGQRHQGEQAQVVGGRRAASSGSFRPCWATCRVTCCRRAKDLASGSTNSASPGVGPVRLDEGHHRVEEVPQMAAEMGRQLAPDQIERLDAVGALVDLG